MSEIEITQEAIDIWHYAIGAASVSGIAFKPAADRRGAEVVQMHLNNIRIVARNAALEEAARVVLAGRYEILIRRVEALEAQMAGLTNVHSEIPVGDNTEEIWTTQECADFLGMTKSKLEKSRLPHLHIDGPPFLKLGANVRYRRSDVLQWLSNKTIQEG